MTTLIQKVVRFPRIVREMNERVDPLDLEQAVIREINWQLNRLGSPEAERECLEYLLRFRNRQPAAENRYEFED